MRLALALSIAVSFPALLAAQDAEPIYGAAAPFARADEHTVAVAAGTRLRLVPHPRSPTIATVDAAIDVPVLETLGDWVRVRYDDWKGWVYLGEDPTPAPPGSVAPDPARLARARDLLGEPAPGELGPFDLYTDVGDPELIRSLSAVAALLPSAYRERFGLDPGTGFDEAVVIFARDADYRAYESLDRSAAPGIEAPGRASQGIAVLVAEEHRDDLAAILVHELTHLLNRRVFATPPPAWLDEGMANDLSYCRIDASGRLELGSLEGRAVLIEQPVYRPGGWLDVDASIHLSGPLASLSLLAEREAAGQAPRLAVLLDLLRGEFMDPLDRPIRFDASAFLVRYLVEERQLGFEAFLAGLTHGGSAQASSLLAGLGLELDELERGFASWLFGQAASRRGQIDHGPAPDP